MTAEIGILNRSAVALAADSAITAQMPTGKKISTSGNKLFALSYRHPVGIMVYNNSFLMEMPWETIIKTYRSTIPQHGFSALADYANSFISFIESNVTIFPNDMRDRFVSGVISPTFLSIRADIDKIVKTKIEQKTPVDDSVIKQIGKDAINKVDDFWEKAGSTCVITTDECRAIIARKRVLFDQCVQTAFGNIPLDPSCSEVLMNIAVNLLAKFTRNNMNTGVVIAGFGENEFLPSITSFTVDGLVDTKLNVFGRQLTSISDKVPSTIMPFAQRDMVDLFIRGVDTSYLTEEGTRLAKLNSDYAEKICETVQMPNAEAKAKLKSQVLDIGTGLMKDYTQNRDAYILKQFVYPVTSVIGLLQKDQLAILAESLVTLTSHKRQFSTDEETVKPPIDVAVITKGDGFIWIQRKHYFKPELNPQYFSNQQGR